MVNRASLPPFHAMQVENRILCSDGGTVFLHDHKEAKVQDVCMKNVVVGVLPTKKALNRE